MRLKKYANPVKARRLNLVAAGGDATCAAGQNSPVDCFEHRTPEAKAKGEPDEVSATCKRSGESFAARTGCEKNKTLREEG